MDNFRNLMSIMKPGYAYVIVQMADPKNMYSPQEGLKAGTIFPTLDKPLGFYGFERLKYEVGGE